MKTFTKFFKPDSANLPVTEEASTTKEKLLEETNNDTNPVFTSLFTMLENLSKEIQKYTSKEEVEGVAFQILEHINVIQKQLEEDFSKYTDELQEKILFLQKNLALLELSKNEEVQKNKNFVYESLTQQDKKVDKAIDDVLKNNEIATNKLKTTLDILEDIAEDQVVKFDSFKKTVETKISEQDKHIKYSISTLKEKDFKELTEQVQQNTSLYLEEAIGFFNTELNNYKEKLKEYNSSIKLLESSFNNILKETKNTFDEEKYYAINQKILYLEQVLEKFNTSTILTESILDAPPSTKTSDPLTPLDQNFVTHEQLSKHYQIFINRIQQQLTTIGGGGAAWLKDLYDVNYESIVNANNGDVLKYNSANNKWEAVILPGGDGSGINLTDLKVSLNIPSGNGTLSYNNTNGTFSFTPANLTPYATVSNVALKANITDLPNANVLTATRLATARNINSVSFDGSVDISIGSLVNGSDTLTLDGANKVNLPGGTSYIFAATNNITLVPDNTGKNYLEIINNVGATVSTDRSFEVRTNTDGTERVWSFAQNGSLFFPDSTIQTTAFSNAAVYANVIRSGYITNTSLSGYATNAQLSSYATVSNVALKANIADLNTSNVSEGANLYYTNARVYANVIALGYASTANLTTANVAEVSNLYFTNARAVAAVANSTISNITIAGNTVLNGNITTTGIITSSITGTPAATALYNLRAANTTGGTNYADFIKLTNTSGGATNPNKYIRLSPGGALEVVNSAYNGVLLELTDSGNFTINGNVLSSGVRSGYSSGRPGFRVYGANTTNNLNTGQNSTGALNINNWAVDFNQGSYLNNSTGVFTAPVAGLYQVNFVCRNAGNTTSISQLAVVKNATGGNGSGGAVQIMVEFAPNSTMNHTGGSSVVTMNSGDTLALKVLAGTINFDGNDNWSLTYIG